jgi:hypothetical protein
MTRPQLPIAQFRWKITDHVCHRIIGIDGQIQCVSTIRPSHFIVNRLWLPSPIKSIVIENMPQLERIESNGFEMMGLRFLRIPDLVEFLGEKCCCECVAFSSITFESKSRL